MALSLLSLLLPDFCNKWKGLKIFLIWTWKKLKNIIVGAQENSFYIYLNIKENNSLKSILQPIFPQLKFHLSLWAQHFLLARCLWKLRATEVPRLMWNLSWIKACHKLVKKHHSFAFFLFILCCNISRLLCSQPCLGMNFSAEYCPLQNSLSNVFLFVIH